MSRALLAAIAIAWLALTSLMRMERHAQMDVHKFDHGNQMREIAVQAKPTYDQLRIIRGKCVTKDCPERGYR